MGGLEVQEAGSWVTPHPDDAAQRRRAWHEGFGEIDYAAVEGATPHGVQTSGPWRSEPVDSLPGWW